MTVAYRSGTVTLGAGGTSTVLTPPAGLANDDILIAQVYAEPGASALTTLPSGFTLIARVDSTNFAQHILWKRAASEAGNYTFTGTGLAFVGGSLHAVSGCITSGSPIDAAGAGNAGVGTTATASSITTLSANTLVCYLEANFDGFDATPPGGMAENFDSNGREFSSVLQAAAGASGAFGASLTSTEWAAVLIALKEAAAAGIKLPQLERGIRGLERGMNYGRS